MCVYLCSGCGFEGLTIHSWQGEGLKAAFMGRFSLDWESEHIGCEGWWWGSDGKCGQQEKLIFLRGRGVYLVPADGCQLAMKQLPDLLSFQKMEIQIFFFNGKSPIFKMPCGPNQTRLWAVFSLWPTILRLLIYSPCRTWRFGSNL